MDVTSGELSPSALHIRGINAGENGHTDSPQNVVVIIMKGKNYGKKCAVKTDTLVVWSRCQSRRAVPRRRLSSSVLL